MSFYIIVSLISLNSVKKSAQTFNNGTCAPFFISNIVLILCLQPLEYEFFFLALCCLVFGFYHFSLDLEDAVLFSAGSSADVLPQSWGMVLNWNTVFCNFSSILAIEVEVLSQNIFFRRPLKVNTFYLPNPLIAGWFGVGVLYLNFL